MTNDQILQIAARHSAYADCTPTLRGDAILAFARDVLQQRELDEFTRKLQLERNHQELKCLTAYAQAQM